MTRAGAGILATAAGAVALAAAACGSVHQAAAPGVPGSIQRSAQTPAATASPGAARYNPCARSFPGMPFGRALASLYAGSLACEFVVPPGAHRLAHAPQAGSGSLQPSPPLPGFQEVDRVQYWQVPGTPRGVLAWEKRHLPSALAASGSGLGYGSRGGITFLWEADYDLPEVPAQASPSGQIYERRMTISAVSAGSGLTDIAVHVSVDWIGPRPAAEVVPPAAHAVTIAVTPGNPHITPPAPVTVTDPAKVRRIVALVDGLPLSPPGVWSCPAGSDATFALTFRAKPGAPALAVAEPDLDGCGWVSFTIAGQRQPSLGSNDGGMSFAASVLRIAGLPWNLSKLLGNGLTPG